ncbi:MAG: ABC transporter ATP-binding protein [Acidobacteriota bacterium]
MSSAPVDAVAPLVSVAGLTKSYLSGDSVLRVLDGTNLSVVAGERLAVLGASGVGKTTLLHLLGGLDRPDAGTITFRGRCLAELKEEELAVFRNVEIGFVFQFYQLLPEFTALENVMMPLLIGRETRSAKHRGMELLEEVGLEERGHHFPTELSGGERQRVAIARALAREPSLLLADEPTGNLDLDSGKNVMRIFGRIQRDHGAAIVMATHNPQLVMGFDRVLQMHSGGHLRPRAIDNVAGGAM